MLKKIKRQKCAGGRIEERKKERENRCHKQIKNNKINSMNNGRLYI
jgi:hypothetical protein